MSDMVISVPHSGTRSLRDHLGLDGYWHFRQNQPDIDVFTGTAHIPLRDPFDIAMSWESRYGDEAWKGPEDMLECFNLMLNYVAGHPGTKLYRVDKLPIHEGRGPKHWARDKRNRGKAAKLDRSLALRRWFKTHETAQTFYTKHFPEGFWWT